MGVYSERILFIVWGACVLQLGYPKRHSKMMTNQRRHRTALPRRWCAATLEAENGTDEDAETHDPPSDALTARRRWMR